MRFAAGLVMVVLALAPGGAVFGQTAPSAPAAPAGIACDARETNLGVIGRVTVFAFVGPVFGGRVCATVANLASDLITARVTDAAPDDALVTAALTGGGDVSAPVGDVAVTGAGPYVIAPGGIIPAFGADTAELPRVVLAYAGQRTFIIATTPIALVDLAKQLRTQPGAFGADAFERAVILASGPAATLSVRTAAGTVRYTAVTPRVLVIIKRG